MNTSMTAVHHSMVNTSLTSRNTVDGPAVMVQINLIITLSLGSMKTDHVISEPCYNEVICNRHIAK